LKRQGAFTYRRSVPCLLPSYGRAAPPTIWKVPDGKPEGASQALTDFTLEVVRR
jgi:hypothetical protein